MTPLTGWCTDRTGYKWHWMNDRTKCRVKAWT